MLKTTIGNEFKSILPSQRIHLLSDVLYMQHINSTDLSLDKKKLQKFQIASKSWHMNSITQSVEWGFEEFLVTRQVYFVASSFRLVWINSSCGIKEFVYGVKELMYKNKKNKSKELTFILIQFYGT